MNEYRKNAINHLKTHLGCVGYRDYLIAELEKLEKIKQILQTRSFTDDSGNACYLDDSERVKQIGEVLESE